MKRFFLLALVFISFKVFGQYPNGQQTIGNDSNIIVPKGALKARVLNNPYTDTTAANLERIKDYPGAQIFTTSDESFWLRNSTATAWLLSVVGVSGLDTVYVADDLYIDSLLNPGFQTIRRLHNDGLVSGGKIIWSGTGLKFYITPAVYYLGGVMYETGWDSVTLAPSDVTNGRFDLFIVDTIPDVGNITGTPSGNPEIPQLADPLTQIVLGSILINAGDTIPTAITQTIIYNQNTIPPEWTHTATGTIAADFDNLANPYITTKAIYVSTYGATGKIYFSSAGTETISPNTALSFFLYTNGNLTGNIHVALYTNATPVSNFKMLGAAQGFNRADSNRYQNITISLSDFVLTPAGGAAGTFNRVVFATTGTDASGSKGFYLDLIQLQSGVTQTPPPTDFSNKLDSVTITKTTVGADTSNLVRTWIKGISKTVGTIWTGGTSGGGGGISEVLAGYGLVQVNDSTLRVDSTLLLTKLMAAATYQPIITLTTTGTSGAATLVGATLNIPQYSGGGTTSDETLTATAGQTAFSFAAVPAAYADYEIHVNGSRWDHTTGFTTSGNVVTTTTPLLVGDLINLSRKK